MLDKISHDVAKLSTDDAIFSESAGGVRITSGEIRMAWWWLSFVDDGSEPHQFLGVALVEAVTFDDALTRAWTLGINPGGQVGFMQISEHVTVPASYRERLLTKTEALELNETWTAPA